MMKQFIEEGEMDKKVFHGRCNTFSKGRIRKLTDGTEEPNMVCFTYKIRTEKNIGK